jgi:hypothetical protein
VYAAFQPKPDLDWLDLPGDVVRRGAALIRHRFTHQRRVELAERTAAALGELRHMYGDAEPSRSSLEEAIAAGGLVLTWEPPCMYWEGRLVEVEWERFPKQWLFLWSLAEEGQREGVVKRAHVYKGSRSNSALAMVFHRLKENLPPSLWTRIRPAHDARGYRLHLERHRIRNFR